MQPAPNSGFRAIIDREPGAVLVQQGGRVAYANRAFATLLGYEDGAELVGLALRELGRRHLALADATWPEGGPASIKRELRLKRRDGGLIVGECQCEPVELDGQAAHAVFVRDVTEAMRVMEALRRSEQNFRKLIEASPHAMCVCTAKHIEYANPAMVEYLGYETEDPLTRPTLAALSDQIIHPGDRERTRAAFQQLFADLGRDAARGPGPVVRIGDIRLRRQRDGALRVCDMYGVIVIHDGAPALVTYLQDLTDQRLNEERMRLADRMSSLGTLAAGVAHEINNPLAYVIANVEFIAHKLDADDSDLAAPLSAVRVGLDRIRKIVQGLKTFSRRDEETIGPVDVRQVLESCIEVAQSQLRHTCTVTRDYEEAPPVRGNEARLAQVFLNLLVNASQSFDEGARERNEVRVKVGRAGARVVIEVSDNGCGIAPADLPRVFDPFFTTKAVGQGTGLGLSVCHGIVTALGGEIAIESAVGQGTSVRVTLEVADRRDQPPISVRPPSRGRRARILAIDDDILLLEAIRRVLEEEHEVVTVTSGQEALDRLTAGESFDLIVCDVVMPGITGVDFYAKVAASMPAVARSIVLLTAGAVTQTTASLLDRSRAPVLTKPFDPKELLAFVRRRIGN